MTEQLESKDKVARKQHICDYCGEIIEKGEEYHYYKGVCDGNIFEWESHLSCQRICDAIWDYADPDEGMTADDFWQCCHDVCRIFVCPDCSEFDVDADSCNKEKSLCLDKLDELFKTKELYLDRREGCAYIWKLRDKK
jgi:hypothetical protein